MGQTGGPKRRATVTNVGDASALLKKSTFSKDNSPTSPNKSPTK